MQILTAIPGLLSHQKHDTSIPPSQRLAETLADDVEPDPEPVDFVGDTVRRILRDKIWAGIMGADEEESGIPPLDSMYEL
ncbi:hypothetical protein [Pinirhizobacter sp.]|jgi:hypothetical protein|uniref:hypothetical protein n=1 Tax=Pinirhizobacter sp. TaxID=2950432 RepID=UPI002F3E706C